MITRVSFFICLLCMALVNAKSNRIVGGDDARPGQFKYQISLQTNNMNICGGAIIGDQYVLTAAHCVVDENGEFKPNNYQIVAGSTNLSTNEGVRIHIEKIYVPREYSPVTYHNDIAVLKLHRALSVCCNRKLQKINLPSSREHRESSYVGRTAVLAGYGFTSIEVRINPETGREEEFNPRTDNTLKHVKVNIISNDECRMRNYNNNINEKQICGQAIQDEQQPRGMCKGDSGSPLVRGNTVIGVASTCPIGCVEDERASVYTRVSSFIGFITQVMKGATTADILVREIHIGGSSTVIVQPGRFRWPC